METKRFEARTGAPFRQEDAQDIGEFIYNECNGLTTREILEKVKKKTTHVIHSYIEWNDKKAGERFRLQQIRNIANHIEIKIEIINSQHETVEYNIRAVHSIKTEKQIRYFQIDEVFQNEEFREQIIQRALIEMQNWIERYKVYNEFKPFIEVLENKLNEMKVIQNEQEGGVSKAIHD